MNSPLKPATVAMLSLAPALWAGNAIVGRLAHDLISPFALNFLRWCIAFVLLLPLATTAGTFAGTVLVSLFLTYSVSECMAVGAGFAYYSLSSIFISQYKGPELGTIALISNIARELITLLLTPLLARHLGPLIPISCGGASTMDTTLPVITRYCGKEWIFVSIVHAMILDFSVPFWVIFFCTL